MEQKPNVYQQISKLERDNYLKKDQPMPFDFTSRHFGVDLVIETSPSLLSNQLPQ